MGRSKSVWVVTPQGKEPSPQQAARVRAFLDTVHAKTLPDRVVVVPQEKFQSTVKALGTGNDTNWAFTLGKDVYLNDRVFDQKHPNRHYSGPDFPEFVLGHEISHINDSDPRWLQESQEQTSVAKRLPNPFDIRSEDLLKTWQKQGGPAYSALKQQAPAAAGSVRPTPVPLLGSLVPPQAPLLGRIR